MMTYSPQVAEFVDAVALVVKAHEHLTNAEVTGGLRILATMLEAMASNGKVEVHLITIQDTQDDSEEIDPADFWKNQ